MTGGPHIFFAGLGFLRPSLNQCHVFMISNFMISNCPQALQCRLDCDAGYMSDLPPIISCVNGNYEPNRPGEFKCQKAVALIVSKTGEMEVFGEDSKCNRLMTNIPSLTLRGHSVSLLDNLWVI